jgi:hypothetical protein
MKDEDQEDIAILEESDEVIDEIIDLEEYAKAGRKPPKAKGYKIKVNDTAFVSAKPEITGREVLELAGLHPPDQYRLRLKVKGEKPQPIGLADVVDLRCPGVEKFRAIRQDQNEGYQGRRDAPVSDQDCLFLDSYGLNWEIIVDGSTWVIFYDFSLPKGFNHAKVTLAVRLEGGYPLTALDMMYTYPAIARADGKSIEKADVTQQIDGLPFQRWSRHRTEVNPWMPGQDSLETHVYLVEEFFETEVTK